MTRERLREELNWGVATALAALFCVSVLPLMLPFLLAERLGGARRGVAGLGEQPRAR